MQSRYSLSKPTEVTIHWEFTHRKTDSHWVLLHGWIISRGIQTQQSRYSLSTVLIKKVNNQHIQYSILTQQSKYSPRVRSTLACRKKMITFLSDLRNLIIKLIRKSHIFSFILKSPREKRKVGRLNNGAVAVFHSARCQVISNYGPVLATLQAALLFSAPPVLL